MGVIVRVACRVVGSVGGLVGRNVAQYLGVIVWVACRVVGVMSVVLWG